MRTMKRNICRLMLLGMLFFTCMMGMADTADAKTGTWKQDKKGWYYSYSDGTYAKNEWVKSGGKWYYFNASGYMQTGWKKIGGKWYYFKANGIMAANEYCKGYWLNKDGTWTAKAEATWKHSKQGWWFEDTNGWYARNQWLMIDGKEYYFLNSGYLAVNRWVGMYYVNSNGTWVKDKTIVDWSKLYLEFLQNKGWKSLGQSSEITESSDARLFDVDHDGLPELLLGMCVYTCSSGKVKYVGKGTGDWWFVIQTSTDPEEVLCSSLTDWNDYKTYYYRITMSSTGLVGKSISNPGKASRRLDVLSVDMMMQELPVYSGLLGEVDPVVYLGEIRTFLDELKFSSNQYDSRKDEPIELNCLYWMMKYPTDPVEYSGAMGYQSGKNQEDPRKKFNGSFYKLNGKKTDWILKNVYNCSDAAVSKMKQKELLGDDEMFPIYYQGGYYYTSPYDNFEGTYQIVIKEIRIVNGLYVIRYSENQSYMGETYDTYEYYAVLGQKSVSGKTFWSMYLNSESCPSDADVKSIKKTKAEKLP